MRSLAIFRIFNTTNLYFLKAYWEVEAVTDTEATGPLQSMSFSESGSCRRPNTATKKAVPETTVEVSQTNFYCIEGSISTFYHLRLNK